MQEPSKTQPELNSRKVFENPLALAGAYQPELHSRIQVDMPRGDRDFFVSIRPTKNTMQTLINILLVKLQQQLKQHGITTVLQQRDFCEYVTSCAICDGRDKPDIEQQQRADTGAVPIGSPTPRTLPETSPSNVRRRKTSAPRKDT